MALHVLKLGSVVARPQTFSPLIRWSDARYIYRLDTRAKLCQRKSLWPGQSAVDVFHVVEFVPVEMLERAQSNQTDGQILVVPPRWLRRTNLGLSLVAAGLAIFIMASPFLPQVTFGVSQAVAKVSGNEAPVIIGNPGKEKYKGPPPPSRVVIPSIGVDYGIREGNDPAKTLDLGIWHRPGTGDPESGGNTVLVGHRFEYTSGPHTFYYLDKLKSGDRFIVYWRNQPHEYEVFETSIVDPTAIEIEAPTREPIVTLYTCTPIWTAAQRLVVKGRPV